MNTCNIRPDILNLTIRLKVRHNICKFFVSQSLNLLVGDQFQHATVIGRKWDHDGNSVGKSHDNPLLDTRAYQVKFAEETTQKYLANGLVVAR
jgi:hypothetical protein